MAGITLRLSEQKNGQILNIQGDLPSSKSGTRVAETPDKVKKLVQQCLDEWLKGKTRQQEQK